MDSNFHYFALKSLAVQAGFSLADAQTLAEYSQFVDDYNRSGSVLFEEVPEFARHLAKKTPSGWQFSCITTGFSSLIDMAGLIRPSHQRLICIPFHFIPPQALNVPVPDEAMWRTEPENLQKPTLLRKLLEQAESRYQQAPDERKNLIALAILLHIFADTYAHQRFSGYGGWWNHGSVLSEECHTGKTLRAVRAATKGLGAVKKKSALPSVFVGHMSFGHTPDKSSVRFTARQKRTKGRKFDLEYSRDNTEIFLEAARHILNFMRRCRALAPVSESQWTALASSLRQGFLTRETALGRLAAHWRKIFPDISYDYAPGKVLQRSVRMIKAPDSGQTNKTAGAQELARLFFAPPEAAPSDAPEAARFSVLGDDFFWFNVFAKEIRDAVNGLATPVTLR